MDKNQRTKMCPNCEGNVAIEVSICPYCGCSVFNKNEKLANQKTNEDVKSMSYEETLASLYPPPYKPKTIETNTSVENEENNEVQKEEMKEYEKSTLVPTILFWIGVNVFVFSLLLLFFSKEGFLYLKWNASYWYLYTLISSPLLYLGFKGLSNLK